MSRPDPRVALFGVLTTLATSGGCENDPCEGVGVDLPPEPAPSSSDPPTVIAGAWLGGGGDVLELQFSKPLHSLGDLDPDRFAIVAWDATDYSYSSDCDPRTRYTELGGTGYYSYNGGVLEAWIAPEDPTRLRLRPNTSASCNPSNRSRGGGVLLVYTNRQDAGPGLLGDDEVTVPDIGPQWAIDRLESCADDSGYCSSVNGYGYGTLPQLDSLADIPCPD